MLRENRAYWQDNKLRQNSFRAGAINKEKSARTHQVGCCLILCRRREWVSKGVDRRLLAGHGSTEAVKDAGQGNGPRLWGRHSAVQGVQVNARCCRGWRCIKRVREALQSCKWICMQPQGSHMLRVRHICILWGNSDMKNACIRVAGSFSAVAVIKCNRCWKVHLAGGEGLQMEQE